MKKLFLSAMVAVVATSANAVPAKRGPYRTVSADGTEMLVQRVGDERGSWFLDMEGNLLRRAASGFEYARMESDGTLSKSLTPIKFNRAMIPADAASGAASMRRSAPALGLFPGASFPAKGEQKALVVLVEFQDTKFNLGDKAKSYFTDMLNKDGFNEYNGTGCAAEYFREMSNGKFDCQFDVYGPITLANNYKYYGGSDDRYAYKMAIEACDALDSEVNFADYDRDNDGYIDNVFIFFAGQGEASTFPENANLVWPHAWNVTAAESTRHRYDGKILDSYGCTNEWVCAYEETRYGYNLVDQYPDGVGTFVHEFSHILGLPDLYLTDESELTASESGYFTPGEWSVLDYGPYNNDGRTPPAYSAFERNALGWMTAEELTADTENPSLTAIEASNHAYSITNPLDSSEFYLLECRTREGWDKYIPGDGMLVWHIDYDSSRWTENSVNNKGSHQYVDLIEADGVAEKTLRTAGDCFPGTKNVTSLTTKWWDKTSTGLKISDITLNSDKTVSFAVSGTGASNGDNNSDWLSVIDVIDSPMTDDEATVRGIIIGYVKAGTFNDKGVAFTAGSVETNLILADDASERNLDNCIPVQLVKSSDARSDLNLKSHPENLGKTVELYGTLSTYMQVPALKNVKTYRFITDEETAIDEVTEVSISKIYDLQGREIAAPRHGQIYIINGKIIKY